MLGDELGHAIVCYPNQIISGASLSNCDSSLGQFFKQQQNGCSRVLFSFSLLTHFTEPCWLQVTIQSSQVEQPSVEPTVDLTTIYLSTHSYYIPDLLLDLPHKVCSSPTKNPIRNHSIPFNLLCCFLKWYVIVANGGDGRWQLCFSFTTKAGRVQKRVYYSSSRVLPTGVH